MPDASAILDQMEAVCKSASKEPWAHIEDGEMFIGTAEQVTGPALSIHGRTNLGRDLQPKKDAEFIAAARPMHPDWARSIRDQCVAAGVPFFFKQWGGWAPCDDSVQHHEHCRRIATSGRDVTHDIALWVGPPTAVPGSDIVMRLIGKKAAGRLLDGREWNELPGGPRCPCWKEKETTDAD